MKNNCLVAAIFAGYLGTTSTTFADCGEVTIASMNWQSSELLANIDKLILSKGFDCEVEMIAGDTVPSITSMVEKGQPDLVPEGWVNTVPELVKRGLEEGRIVVASEPLSDGGIQGLWMPKYFADAHPEIKTIGDVLGHPELFPAHEDPSKGAIVTSPQGWGAATIIAQLFKANGGEQTGFILVDPGSSAGLDGSLARAYERRAPWVGYYWAPTSMLGKYPMVRVELGAPYDPAEWKRCTTVSDCADPKRTEWPRDTVQTLVTSKFAQKAGPALDYLRKRTMPNDLVNQLSSYMTDNQATGEDGAIHFLKEHKEIWTKWVSPEITAKVEASL